MVRPEGQKGHGKRNDRDIGESWWGTRLGFGFLFFWLMDENTLFAMGTDDRLLFSVSRAQDEIPAALRTGSFQAQYRHNCAIEWQHSFPLSAFIRGGLAIIFK
jgi:hypothetical protein